MCQLYSAVWEGVYLSHHGLKGRTNFPWDCHIFFYKQKHMPLQLFEDITTKNVHIVALKGHNLV